METLEVDLNIFYGQTLEHLTLYSIGTSEGHLTSLQNISRGCDNSSVVFQSRDQTLLIVGICPTFWDEQPPVYLKTLNCRIEEQA